ncbi:MAG TPA: restriction endonuclease subunit S [Agriterribacter sp.]|nr:restriction endonuclease subunit S [Chitinophagaceae bacterium]HRP31753.1 restriction endonuclease subunit S [Agriterribacter sp.]
MTEVQNMKQLPEGWKWVKLGDALDYVIGGDWGKDENFDDPDYTNAYCIRGAEIKNWDEEKGRTASLRKIKLTNIEKRRLIEGDILVEISGGGPEQPVGRTVLIDKSVLSYKPEVPKICTNFLRLIRPKGFVDSTFLNQYLKLFYYSGEIVNYQAGSNNLRNLKFPDYIKIYIPLPPLPIQTAIVAKIEELFSELDKGIEQLKTAQQQLKTYRQAVLKRAFEGKLSESGCTGLMDEQDGIKQEILQSSHPANPASDNGGLPEGWRIEKLIDIGTWKGGGTPSKANKTFWENGTILWVSPKDMKSKVINDTLDKITSVAIENSSAKLVSKGSILFVVRSGILRRTLPVAIAASDVTVNQDIQAFTPKNILSDYVYWYAQAKNVDIRKECSKDGTTVESIESSLLRNYPIPVCSPEEQLRIVRSIESRLSVADKLEENITQSLQQAAALRQSILKKAFEGRLL